MNSQWLVNQGIAIAIVFLFLFPFMAWLRKIFYYLLKDFKDSLDKLSTSVDKNTMVTCLLLECNLHSNGDNLPSYKKKKIEAFMKDIFDNE